MVLRRISSSISELGNTENLDTFITTGVWHQRYSRNADPARGYPEANAGLLEVHGTPTMVYQRYTIYYGRGMYYRAWYSGSWSPWRRIQTT